eukprot:12327773-Alexandrium_andersonii.AAC.1
MGRLGPHCHARWRPARPTLLCTRLAWGPSVPMDPWGPRLSLFAALGGKAVSYTHLRAHETSAHL